MILAGFLCFSDHSSFSRCRPPCPPASFLSFHTCLLRVQCVPGLLWSLGHSRDTQERFAFPGADSPVGETGKSSREWPHRREQETGTLVGGGGGRRCFPGWLRPLCC